MAQSKTISTGEACARIGILLLIVAAVLLLLWWLGWSALHSLFSFGADIFGAKVTWWIIGICVLLFLLFRHRSKFSGRFSVNTEGLRTIVGVVAFCAGFYFVFWSLKQNAIHWPWSSTVTQSSGPVNNPFLGMRQINLGDHLYIDKGKKYVVEPVNGKAMWFHPKKNGEYLATICTKEGTLYCSSKIVKTNSGVQYLSVIAPPANVVIEGYTISFDTSGEFDVSDTQ